MNNSSYSLREKKLSHKLGYRRSSHIGFEASAQNNITKTNFTRIKLSLHTNPETIPNKRINYVKESNFFNKLNIPGNKQTILHFLDKIAKIKFLKAEETLISSEDWISSVYYLLEGEIQISIKNEKIIKTKIQKGFLNPMLINPSSKNFKKVLNKKDCVAVLDSIYIEINIFDLYYLQNKYLLPEDIELFDKLKGYSLFENLSKRNFLKFFLISEKIVLQKGELLNDKKFYFVLLDGSVNFIKKYKIESRAIENYDYNNIQKLNMNRSFKMPIEKMTNPILNIVAVNILGIIDLPSPKIKKDLFVIQCDGIKNKFLKIRKETFKTHFGQFLQKKISELKIQRIKKIKIELNKFCSKIKTASEIDKENDLILFPRRRKSFKLLKTIHTISNNQTNTNSTLRKKNIRNIYQKSSYFQASLNKVFYSDLNQIEKKDFLNRKSIFTRRPSEKSKLSINSSSKPTTAPKYIIVKNNRINFEKRHRSLDKIEKSRSVTKELKENRSVKRTKSKSMKRNGKIIKILDQDSSSTDITNMEESSNLKLKKILNRLRRSKLFPSKNGAKIENSFRNNLYTGDRKQKLYTINKSFKFLESRKKSLNRGRSILL